MFKGPRSPLLPLLRQESPADAMVTRDSSACMKAPMDTSTIWWRQPPSWIFDIRKLHH